MMKISFFDFDVWVLKMLYYDTIDLSKGIDVAKRNNSKKVCFVTIGILRGT